MGFEDRIIEQHELSNYNPYSGFWETIFDKLFRSRKECSRCEGEGRIRISYTLKPDPECSICKGDGYDTSIQPGYGEYSDPSCSCTSAKEDSKCHICNGKGIIK